MSSLEESELSDVSNENVSDLSEDLDNQLLSEEEEEQDGIEEDEDEVEEEEEEEEDDYVDDDVDANPNLEIADPDDEEFDPEPKAYEEDELYEEEEEEFKPTKGKRATTKKLPKIPKSSARSTPARGAKSKKIEDDDFDEVLPTSKRASRKLQIQEESNDTNNDEEEDDEDDEDSINADLLLTDEEEWEMNTGPTKDISRMTERQRSKILDKQIQEEALSNKYNIDSDNNGLLQLSNEPSKRKVFTEEELQLRKAETARKRKNFTEKKLEEEKQDTLNKLLKKRATKVRDIKSLNEEDPASFETPRRPVLAHKALFRYTISKDSVTLAIPNGLDT